MAGRETVIVEIGERIKEAQQNISDRPWKAASRPAFLAALEKSVSDLAELHSLFSRIVGEMDKNPEPGKPEVKPFLEELEKLLKLLKRNLEMEKGKRSTAKTANELDKEETPELYADLQHKILASLLKARYALEKTTIFLRRQGFEPITDKSTAKQVMEVLSRKEEELQELREKYENIRKRSYLGYFEEGTVADLEQELGDLAKRMALSANELGKSISFHRSQIEYIENSYAELKQKLDSLEELFSQYSEKSEELIKSLKKERDYAKKIVLDVEHETLQLRNTYTREMLNLQETKLAVKREAERKFSEEIKKLARQLSEQQDLARHFRKVAEDKLKKEHELEEKVKQLTLLCKTKEKHEAVKRHYKKGKKKK
ncbi:MAG: hypothetical protein JW744_03675 [Candidatus Diapherotrites archaeon]|uniref:Uncharacterized protein n=1 Tax=Candidatus Iainarchaeum sp. TaxID=3101447 RepID=A0A938YXL4_9ARCH|nr:hypothetical protein [Candidatus Diapherotrites archaeon]